ncbi:polysaccharide transporter [Halobaculum sp. MBLA0143]|uniref:polysaccharide transporter n=1 Tax=Halobaculum sp. MBLA0143 TaxID=3079933 RepID=UPI003523F27A
MGDPTDEFVSVRELPRVVEARRLDEQRGIETREGTIVGHSGDVLIRGVDDELYPCDSEIFDQTYEVVD